MTKEYDSTLTIDEVVARLREKTVSGGFSKDWYSWACCENLDGTYRIWRNNHARANVHATLKILPMSQGTHTVFETDSWWRFLCLCCFILLEISPILVYRSVSNGSNAEYAVLSLVFGISFFMLFAWIDRSREKDLIDFFEADILGIKKRT